jgi:hypothetical protein
MERGARGDLRGLALALRGAALLAELRRALLRLALPRSERSDLPNPPARCAVRTGRGEGRPRAGLLPPPRRRRRGIGRRAAGGGRRAAGGGGRRRAGCASALRSDAVLPRLLPLPGPLYMVCRISRS